MLCIFRKPAAFRPLTGMRANSSYFYRYPRPDYPSKWFSQSSKLYAGPKHYTQEQLAAFTNHYAILGLSNNATDRETKSAYISLCKRFHPDMMRNVDSPKYCNNPDRPEYVKVSTQSSKNSRAETALFFTND